MPTAHLIHGFLGAGKTTFARHLERELPGIRFTHDEWMTRLYGRDPPADLFPQYFERVSSLIEPVWTRCLELGLDVVLDLNFWSRRERDRTRDTVARLNGKIRLYRLACPEPVAWSRIAERNLAENSDLYISRPTFDLLKERFEPLQQDEDHICIET